MQKLSVCLLFDHQAEAAALFYTSVFPGGKILTVTRMGPNEYGGEEGSVRTVSFELFGLEYLAVNGGPHFSFNDGVSLVILCDTQEEIDSYWEKLTADGGREVECGWVMDRFGMRWQIVPRILNDLMTDPDQKKSNRVMQALLQMKKLHIDTLVQAYQG